MAIDPTDPRYFSSDGVEPLLADQPCPRCGVTEWYSYKDRLDFRCGGCGYWYFDDNPRWREIIGPGPATLEHDNGK